MDAGLSSRMTSLINSGINSRMDSWMNSGMDSEMSRFEIWDEFKAGVSDEFRNEFSVKLKESC